MYYDYAAKLFEACLNEYMNRLYSDINTFKYHVSSSDGKFQLELIYFYYLFPHLHSYDWIQDVINLLIQQTKLFSILKCKQIW